MSYRAGLDQLANRIVPDFLRNPKMISWINANLYPLHFINEEFIRFAEEKKLEANLNSQTMLLEWYLNKKYDYLYADVNPTQRIQIKHFYEDGLATYNAAEWTNLDPDGGAGTGVVTYFGDGTSSQVGGTIKHLYSPPANYIQDTMRAVAGELHIQSGDYVDLSNKYSLNKGSYIEFTFKSPEEGQNVSILGSSTDDSAIIFYNSLSPAPPDRILLTTSSGFTYQVNLPSGNIFLTNTYHTIRLERNSIGDEIEIIIDTVSYGTQSISTTNEFNINTINKGQSYEFTISDLDINNNVFEFNESDNEPEIYGVGTSIAPHSVIYFDIENAGAINKDFVVLLPNAIQGNSTILSQIKSTIDKYVIDIKKYDTEYIQN